MSRAVQSKISLVEVQAKLDAVEAVAKLAVAHCEFLRQGQQEMNETLHSVDQGMAEIRGRRLHETVEELGRRLSEIEYRLAQRLSEVENTLAQRLGARSVLAILLGIAGGGIGAAVVALIYKLIVYLAK